MPQPTCNSRSPLAAEQRRRADLGLPPLPPPWPPQRTLWRRFVLLLALSLLLIFGGCATLADRRVAAGCQIADGVTTYAALRAGAVEANPLLASLSGSQILLLKVLLAVAIWKLAPEPDAVQVASVAGCLPAISNALLL